MSDPGLLVLNTEGSGVDTPGLVQRVRAIHAELPVLHIGNEPIPGIPGDVRNLPESFTINELVRTVAE